MQNLGTLWIYEHLWIHIEVDPQSQIELEGP